MAAKYSEIINVSTNPNHPDNVRLDDITRVDPFAKRNPDVVGSPSRLRYLLRHRHTNGLMDSGAVVERGRTLYIVKPKFLDWLLGGRNVQRDGE